MYLEIDESFPGHRKTIRFCGLMKDHNAFAYLLRLWTWAARSSPDGDLTALAPADIEIAVQYRPGDGRCYAAMVTAGFIDEGAPGVPEAIHNWMDRTGAGIKRMEEAAEASRERKRRWRDAQRARREASEGVHDDVAERGTERGHDGDGDDEEHVTAPHSTGQPSPDQARQVQTRQDQASPDPIRSGSDRSVSAVTLWEPREWCRQFGMRWTKAKNRLAYGDARDSTGCGQLADIFERIGPEARVLLQANAEEHFADYLAEDDPAVLKAGHPFSWFVTRLTGMRTRQQTKRAARRQVAGTDRKLDELRSFADRVATPEELAELRESLKTPRPRDDGPPDDDQDLPTVVAKLAEAKS